MWLALLISLSITRLIKDCLIYIYKKAYPTIASNAIELKRNTTPLVVDVQLMNPSDIETRQEFGHFEAGTVLSGKRKGAKCRDFCGTEKLFDDLKDFMDTIVNP